MRLKTYQVPKESNQDKKRVKIPHKFLLYQIDKILKTVNLKKVHNLKIQCFKYLVRTLPDTQIIPLLQEKPKRSKFILIKCFPNQDQTFKLTDKISRD